eukprot:TRINITY_DN1293_c1_g1_i1.p1 TRINITY_DN1293_c1_g1~~TRINITY_DN1293_c1_g1_i1.p1  ORF type:complete len:311 (-),score=55.43 TRINITY_DN1293_c1_g1_i1:115-1047(-)
MVDVLSLHHLPVDVQRFEFLPDGSIFGTHPYVPMFGVPLYLLTLFLLKKIIKKPFDLNWLVIVHNSMLSIASAMMFCCMVAELYRMYTISDFWTTYADPTGRFAKGTLTFVLYLNYLSKIWELLDTVLLCLRGKELEFLHVYHHAATFALTWTQLHAAAAYQWVAIGFNMWVHIWMYMYYAMHALGINCWWKRYLTIMQIVQFITGLTSILFGYTTSALYVMGVLSDPHWVIYCRNWPLLVAGSCILASYLYLFIQLYRNRYNTAPHHGKGKSNNSKPLLKEKDNAPHGLVLADVLPESQVNGKEKERAA